MVQHYGTAFYHVLNLKNISSPIEQREGVNDLQAEYFGL